MYTHIAILCTILAEIQSTPLQVHSVIAHSGTAVQTIVDKEGKLLTTAQEGRQEGGGGGEGQEVGGEGEEVGGGPGEGGGPGGERGGGGGGGPGGGGQGRGRGE